MVPQRPAEAWGRGAGFTVTRPLGKVWVECPGSVVGTGLVQALRQHAWVHTGNNPPPEGHSCVIICANDPKDLSERVEHHKELSPEEHTPILVFGLYLNLPLAREALRAGGSGFIHAEMTTSQLLRAVAVAQKGELVAPRELLRYMLTEEDPVDLAALSARQREILGLVVEGLSNAEIARRLFLSESTVKQHLRGAYKLLGASNRTEAARLFRRSP
jgi:DNA-binding NarL/FixJ family response regulator